MLSRPADEGALKKETPSLVIVILKKLLWTK